MSVHSASPAEIQLAPQTLKTVRVGTNGPGRPRQNPPRLIADKAYDCDAFRDWLKGKGIELIAPHRKNRTRTKRQDGRALRRYRRRWKIERSFAWLGNYRRLVVRWDRSIVVYRAFVHVACALIALRGL